MMDVLAIPRTAVDRSLRILRLPLDTTIGVLDREGDRAIAITLVVDRADASVRRLAGRVLHDELLQRDAQARVTAVEERQSALDLRVEARLRRRRADAESRDDLEAADARRVEAERHADHERKRVEEERQAASRQRADQVEQRKVASRKAAERTERNIAARAQKARLEQLERDSAVLVVEEQSTTTTSEAQRLQRAASEAKSKRKSGSPS
jgi:hypothetical protein